MSRVHIHSWLPFCNADSMLCNYNTISVHTFYAHMYLNRSVVVGHAVYCDMLYIVHADMWNN